MENVASLGSQIVSTFVDAFTGLTAGLGTGIVDTFNSLFMNANGGLSNLAIWGLVFGGVSLGIGIISKFTRKAG